MVLVNSFPLALLVAFVAVAELPVHEPDEPLTLPVTLPVRFPLKAVAVTVPVLGLTLTPDANIDVLAP